MNAADILAITEPESLFDFDTIKADYRRLANAWHPDKGGDDAVFAHIQKLYELAEQKLETGIWSGRKELTFITKAGKKFKLKFDWKGDFELGTVFIGNRRIGYYLTNQYDDLWANAVMSMGQLKFKDDKLKQEFAKCFPVGDNTFDSYECQEGTVVIIKIPEGFLRLKEVSDYMGEMPAVHVAWIISRLLNICVYLNYAGIVHNAITIDNVFISAEKHWAGIYGGWWYATRQDEKMVALPQNIHQIIPSDILRNKISHYRTDLEAVKAIGRRLLCGNVSGSGMQKCHAPQVLIDWLSTPVSHTAKPLAVFNYWYQTLIPQAFGKREFVELNINRNHFYQEQ